MREGSHGTVGAFRSKSGKFELACQGYERALHEFLYQPLQICDQQTIGKFSRLQTVPRLQTVSSLPMSAFTCGAVTDMSQQDFASSANSPAFTNGSGSNGMVGVRSS